MLIDKKEEISNEIKILRAAEEEFMQLGYDGAKTTSIAKKAGVTHAMLHYYFRTKENLFNKVYHDKIDLMAQSITPAFINNNGNFVESLKAGIESHFDFLARNPDLPRFLVNELISKPERLKALETKMQSFIAIIAMQLQGKLDDAHKKGIIRKIKIFDLLIDIVSMNVFIFIAIPLLRNIAITPFGTEEDFLAARRKESVEVIMSRILLNRTDV